MGEEENATVTTEEVAANEQETQNPENQTNNNSTQEETNGQEAENSVMRQMRKQLTEANKRIKEFEAKQKEQDFAKLSKAEREKAEFEETRKQFEAEKAEFERVKQTSQISSDLLEKGLPQSFAKALSLIGDNEKVLNLIEQAVKEQNDIIEKRTREYLSGKPQKITGGTNGAITKEQFNKMTYSEKTKLYQENPGLFNQLKQ